MSSVLLLSALGSDRYRVAILDHGEPPFVDELPDPSRIMNIYKGRVVSIEPSIQSAFVDIGGDRNAFLHITDIEPGCYAFRKAKPRPGQEKPPIEDIFQCGDDVIVQILEEATDPRKGPLSTTYLSIAGPGLLLMSGLDGIRVSKKVPVEAHPRLRETIRQLQPLPGLGFIVRPGGVDCTPEEFNVEMAYLKHTWLAMLARCIGRSPTQVYRTCHPVAWLMKSLCTALYDHAWIDDTTLYEKARTFARAALPHLADRIQLYEGAQPLMEHHGIREEYLRRAAPRTDGPEDTGPTTKN
jgi:ribonuclease E